MVETVKIVFQLPNRAAVSDGKGGRHHLQKKKKRRDLHIQHSSSTIPLTSGIEEAPQLLLRIIFYHNSPGVATKYLRGFQGAACRGIGPGSGVILPSSCSSIPGLHPSAY